MYKTTAHMHLFINHIEYINHIHQVYKFRENRLNYVMRTSEKLKYIFTTSLDILGKHNGRQGSFSCYLKLAVSQSSDSSTFIYIVELYTAKHTFKRNLPNFQIVASLRGYLSLPFLRIIKLTGEYFSAWTLISKTCLLPTTRFVIVVPFKMLTQ